jgi:ribA/ribD-fused uncharacterized protein
MTDIIDSFSGEYAFLSNFYHSPVVMGDHVYGTVEHAFQACKTEDPTERLNIRATYTPGQAKKLGRKATLRPGWDSVRVDVMASLLSQKFGDSFLRNLLVQTGDAVLCEGNTWGDEFWGATWHAIAADERSMNETWHEKNGRYLVGQNHLGQLLMTLRSAVAPSAT